MLVAALFCLLPQTGFAEGIPALKILEGMTTARSIAFSPAHYRHDSAGVVAVDFDSHDLVYPDHHRVVTAAAGHGTAQTPPNQVLVGIASFTLFIMNQPSGDLRRCADARQNDEISFQEGLIVLAFHSSNLCWAKLARKT